jgi:1-acyl-sn-glycerol-3-phosphate acyltransferase
VNSAPYRVSFGLRLQRWVLTRVIRFLFKVGGTVRLSGAAHVPLGTSYVVAINHVSIYDPPLLLVSWPETLEAIGAVDVFDKPVQGQLLAGYGVVPVHRGQYDRELIDIVLSMLRAGHAMLIAPEGSRSHGGGMQRAKPGIAYIVDEAHVPVVPVGIVGTTDDYLKQALRFQRPALELRIGKPFTLPAIEGRGEQRREARQRNADLVMQHIAGLLPFEYRGVYADSAISPG